MASNTKGRGPNTGISNKQRHAVCDQGTYHQFPYLLLIIIVGNIQIYVCIFLLSICLSI